MPGNFAAAINIENFCAVSGTLFRQCALAGSVDKGMLQQNQRIGATTCCDLCVDAPLNREGIFILN
jgi:hypothetical protein